MIIYIYIFQILIASIGVVGGYFFLKLLWRGCLKLRRCGVGLLYLA